MITQEWQSSDVICIDEIMYPVDIDQIIYSNCGFFFRKMLEKDIVNSCAKCSESFQSVEENSLFNISFLIQLRDEGNLIYPDFNFFNLIKSIDQLYSQYISNTNVVYYNVINDIQQGKIELFFPCEAHNYDIVSELI